MNCVSNATNAGENISPNAERGFWSIGPPPAIIKVLKTTIRTARMTKNVIISLRMLSNFVFLSRSRLSSGVRHPLEISAASTRRDGMRQRGFGKTSLF